MKFIYISTSHIVINTGYNFDRIFLSLKRDTIERVGNLLKVLVENKSDFLQVLHTIMIEWV